MAGISSQAAGKMENKFKYNGKEFQHEEFSDGSGLEEYDYDARRFNPQIGRFSSIDPNSFKYPWITGYNYAFNNPALVNDPT